MIILALDVGSKRIGIAVSDPLGMIATGLPTLERQDLAWDLEAIQKIVNERKVQMILLGLPLHMNGRHGKEADEVLKFRDDLMEKTHLPVEVIDERWTTVAAERTLLEGDLSRKKRKGKIDQVAAQIILQSYLERERFKS
ncbi:MAG: Holliday junction resolvase RuvX [Chlamydiae bacterium]|nr:Holliday junction resolvase RuvX [Chlamydiota bacterium]MBI3277064.1 Holliday junction resolvase RuvX [Chlamydiota bacterium]